MAWVAFSKQAIIGPNFFPASVTKEAYLEMLQNFFLPGLRSRKIAEGSVFD